MSVLSEIILDEVTFLYDGGYIAGDTKAYLADIGAKKGDISAAIRRFEDTPEFKKLVDEVGEYASSSNEEARGTLRFGKVKSYSSDSYKIYATGQIRREVPGTAHTRLKSVDPKLNYVDGDPVATIFNNYMAAAKELLGKRLVSGAKNQVHNIPGNKHYSGDDTLILKNQREITDLSAFADVAPKRLDVVECNKLLTLDGINSSRLTNAVFRGCAKLKSLNGLPSELRFLSIVDCPSVSFVGIEKILTEVASMQLAESPMSGAHNFKAMKILHLLKVKKIGDLSRANRAMGVPDMIVLDVIRQAMKDYDSPKERLMWATRELMNQGIDYKQYI